MFIVELVMQGVRGIRELARLRFQGGFNLVVAGNEAGKTSSADSVLRLLFPRNETQAIDSLKSRITPDASRAALVAFSDDGAYYRVIEDFSKGAINLSQYHAATKEFTLMHKDWDSAARFMAELSNGISEEEYNSLYIFRREQYAVRSGPASSPAPVPRPVVTGRPASAPKAAPAAHEARLAELRETLRKSEEAADADYKVQAGKLRLEEIRKKIDGIEDINRRYADIDKDVATLKACAELPENLGEVIEEHEHRQGEKMARTDELNKELAGLNHQIDSFPSANLMKDPLFIAGIAVAALSIAAALFVLTTEQADYFPLGILLSLTLIAVAWYKGSRKNTERKILVTEAQGLQAELADIEKSFEQGGSAISACMKATGSATTAELKDKAENYRYFLSMREEIDEQRKRMLGDLSPEDLQAEYGKQQEEIVELEKAAAALARYNVDAYSIRQDIERLEMESSGGAPADFGGGQEVLSDFSFSEPLPEASPAPAGILAELAMASRIVGIEMETLVPAVEAAAQRNLSAISGGKYVRLEAGQESDPLVHARDDSLHRYSELSHGTKNLIYFCLRTGLVEALAGKRRLPFLLDDPLAGFDPERQQAACQILRTLGAKTQVILFTSNPALKATGDAAAELK
jgi:uncharacterized protein YhaN